MSLKSLRNGLLTPQYETMSRESHLRTFVIRQQMSPFYPFRGGGSPKGDNVPFFTVFFYRRASLRSLLQPGMGLEALAQGPRGICVSLNLENSLFQTIPSRKKTRIPVFGRILSLD